MELETIIKLLEKLDKKQYSDIIRKFSQHNKRLKVPGFTSIEKVPLKLIANNAKTNKLFRKALLDEISSVVLTGIDINMDQDITTIKNNIPKDKWLGLAAFLLLLNNESHTAEAKKIIEEFAPQKQSEDIPKEIDDNTKEDKKEEKFREKYLKAKRELADIKVKLETGLEAFQKLAIDVGKLEDEKRELEQRCMTYLVQIETLRNENSRLTHELKKAEAKEISYHQSTQRSIDIKILAPCCEDILNKYCGITAIDFENRTELLKEEILEKYDEIWVFPDVIPYSTYRMLCKWKKEADDKIMIFQAPADLVARAEKLTQMR